MAAPKRDKDQDNDSDSDDDPSHPRRRRRRSRGVHDIVDNNSTQRRTKKRRKANLPSLLNLPSPLVPLVQLLWLLCCLSQLAHNTRADCPAVCECKWKSGKESVLCLNANLTQIPLPLDAGTQVLDLSGNEIATIPHDSFAAAQLLNLQKVYLARCRLRVIERHAFRKLINLVELDLSQNQLNAIPSHALEFISELRELKLSGNPIARVPDDAFEHVPQLVRLELSDCRLAAVEVRAFAGLESSLEWLKLDGNRLSEVRSGTITSLTSLHGLELARNQWNCSCSLRPLRAWMLQQNIPCGIPPLCHAPERLAGRAWDKIDLDDFACVPQIVATDTTAHGVEGRNVTMSCYVEGVPEPAVRWLVKNRVIANLSAGGEPSAGPRTAAATQGRKTYVVNMLRNASNLTILTADMQDAGIYTCAAENKAGKVEASVTLAVSRRPPEAPLGVRIVLLGVLAALLFVVGSSFAAICFCSLRRRRKLRLWNSVPPARTESYEKIEMTARVSAGAGRPDLGGGASCGGGSGTGAGLFHDDEHGYLRSAHTPLNCGSDDGGDTGHAAIVNPSGGGSARRNGDYLHVPTHCDDEGTGYEEDDVTVQSSQPQSTRKASMGEATTTTTMTPTTFPAGARWTTSPQDAKRQPATAGITNNSAAPALEETDLHIPRLIDIGGNDSASSSISSQVDAAARLAGYAQAAGWKATTMPMATTKITSPHSKQAQTAKAARNGGGYYGNPDDMATSVFCSSNSDGQEHDLFDSNYPDLLDIAKYAVAQAAQSNHAYHNALMANAAAAAANGGLCTLPRKLKHSGKYFKNSSDSQSPLLADNSSKYGSSILGDSSFLNEAMGLGRRYSAESSYANYASTATYTSGQRSNSFLNLVQSGVHKGGGNAPHQKLTNGLLAASRRNPSLPSSPVHEMQQQQQQLQQQQQQQQHQRSFSSAATPLLDFSALTTRAGGAVPASSLPPAPPVGSSVAAYDYHAAQLERFLEEYRNLQDQLCKMKETCDTIRKKEAPLRVPLGQSAQLADPVMFNAAMSGGSSGGIGGPHSPKPPTTLKTKALLPGQPPDPPPYWLHRNAMFKRLNENSGGSGSGLGGASTGASSPQPGQDIFKS